MATDAAHFGKEYDLESSWEAWQREELEVGNLDSRPAAETDEHASMQEVATSGEES